MEEEEGGGNASRGKQSGCGCAGREGCRGINTLGGVGSTEEEEERPARCSVRREEDKDDKHCRKLFKRFFVK
jgi:hypothetical protein